MKDEASGIYLDISSDGLSNEEQNLINKNLIN